MNQSVRDAIRNVELPALRRQFSGARYSTLIQEHVRKLGDGIATSHAACLSAFTEVEWSVINQMTPEYQEKATEKSFWRRDCGEVFQEICSRFGELMREKGHATDDRITFNAFQALTINFARQAHESKELRIFAGIRKSFLFR